MERGLAKLGVASVALVLAACDGAEGSSVARVEASGGHSFSGPPGGAGGMFAGSGGAADGGLDRSGGAADDAGSGDASSADAGSDAGSGGSPGAGGSTWGAGGWIIGGAGGAWPAAGGASTASGGSPPASGGASCNPDAGAPPFDPEDLPLDGPVVDQSVPPRERPSWDPDPCPAGSPDADRDGTCDVADICAGVDDRIDTNDDGVPDGCPVALVQELASATVGSVPSGFTEADGQLYFHASLDGQTELVRSDRTAAGTTPLLQLPPGAGRSFTTSGTALYFVTGPTGYEQDLWTIPSRGAAPRRLGRGVLREIAALPHGVIYDVELYANGQRRGELWYSDGVRTGKVGDFPSYLGRLTAAGGLVYFDVNDGTGEEPWRTDGTPEGTFQVGDLLPATPFSGSDARAFTAFGGMVYFIARGPDGDGLYETSPSGCGTRLVALTDPYTDSIATGTSRIYFATGYGDLDNVTYYAALWTSDGTTAGTRIVRSFDGESVSNVLSIGDDAYFRVHRDGGGDAELYVSDGTDVGTRVVGTMPDNSNSGYWPFTAMGDSVYFVGPDVYRANKAIGVQTIHDGPVPVFAETVAVGDRIAFQFLSTAHGNEPWLTDGTAAGTALLADVSRAPYLAETSEARLFGPVGAAERLVATAAPGPYEHQVWQLAGTPVTATMVLEREDAPGTDPAEEFLVTGETFFFVDSARLYRLSSGGAVTRLEGGPARVEGPGLVAGTRVFFRASWQAFDQVYLWSVPLANLTAPTPTLANAAPVQLDGRDLYEVEDPVVVAGSVYARVHPNGLAPLVVRASGVTATAVPGTEGGVAPLTALGSRLYFHRDGSLSTTDGVAAAATLVGPQSTRCDRPVVSSGYLYYCAPGAIARTNGTSPETVATHLATSVSDLTPLGARVYFRADTGTSGGEPWVIDAGASAARLLADVFAGPESSSPEDFTEVGPHVYFTAQNEGGRDLFRTDGTTAGTRRVMNLDTRFGFPRHLRVAGGKLYFVAASGARGVGVYVVK